MGVDPKIIVPFVAGSWPLHAVKLALKQDGHTPRFVHMEDDTSYFNLVSGLWSAAESFLIIEHDIVVHPGAIDSLTLCPEPWCTFPYYCSLGWIIDGLGCVKFSADLIRSHPDFFSEPFPACCAHTRHYCGLDRLIAHRMESFNLKPHVHLPGVVNLNEKFT